MPIAEVKLTQILCALNECPPHDEQCGIGSQTDLRKFKAWFLQQFGNGTMTNSSSCSLEDFAVYFLRKLRLEIELHLRTSDTDTEKCPTPVRKIQQNQRRSNMSQHDAPAATVQDLQLSTQSPAAAGNVSLDASAFAHDMSSYSSTPVRRSLTNAQHPRRSANNSGYNASNISGNNSGTSMNSSFGKQRSSYANTSAPTATTTFCLGDFLLTSPALNNRMTKKKSQNNHQQQQQQHNSNATEKPKKRVQLRTIKHTSLTPIDTSFGNASFESQDQETNASATHDASTNNSKMPVAAKSPPTILPISTTTIAATPTTITSPQLQIDLATVTYRCLLERLARIHAVLIDLNLCVSVLNEISFLLSLLNNQNVATPDDEVSSSKTNQITSPADQDMMDVTAALSASYTNCVYFAICVLRLQRDLLALLDLKSLDAVLQIDNLNQLAQDLKQYLVNALQQKQHLDAQSSRHMLNRGSRTFKKVYFHEEQNSRHCFSSNNEFGAFKTQRDLFYDALKLWETNHMAPSWNFHRELTPKINEIFRQSENPINMTHFAQLFVAQLLISALEATSPEEIGLKLDMEKLSKLTKRMIVPGTFSTDYQFPRSQAFFRDFILAAKSYGFMEQLKIALYVQLITMNNSSIEQQCLYANEHVDEDEGGNEGGARTAAGRSIGTHMSAEYIVRPDVLASMLILAKFLGFVQALPFQLPSASNDNASIVLPAHVERQQLDLRSRFQPNFNVCQLLQTAISERKLLITLPWLVQYMAMLDNVSLQLPDTAAALLEMYALYMELGMDAECSTQLLPISAFIVRCCIGWLCEKRNFIAEQYYVHRATLMRTKSKYFARQHLDESAVSALPMEEQLVISALQINSSMTGEDKYTKVNPPTTALLETLINVACPFLAEFRVAIKPVIVARTGNYRCIVTRMYELPSQPKQSGGTSNTDTVDAQQSKLVEVFLQSQPPSMRTMIEYIIERTYKATVKDAQYQILLPSKSAADAEINKITSTNLAFVTEVVERIYGDAKVAALKQWDEQVPQVLSQRIDRALVALLPADTLAIVKDTYYQLIERSAMQKIQQWCHDNMLHSNFYCNNYFELVRKICKANSRERVTPLCTELRLMSGNQHISELLDRLQYQLHCSEMRTDLPLTSDEILELLRALHGAFENTLPPLFYHLVAAYVLELMQHIVRKRPKLINEELVEAACQIWLHPKQQPNNEPNQSDPGVKLKNDNETSSSTLPTQQLPNIFNALLTEQYIETLPEWPHCFHSLERLLIVMIKKQVISVDFVNVSFMKIFKREWPATKLNLISTMLSTVAKETAAIVSKDPNISVRDQHDNTADADSELADMISVEKSHLIMEVLADFSRDIENF